MMHPPEVERQRSSRGGTAAIRRQVSSALSKRRRGAAVILLISTAGILAGCAVSFSKQAAALATGPSAGMDTAPMEAAGHDGKRVLCSYSYYEKDAVQKENLMFFMRVGMGLHSTLSSPAATDFIIAISGDSCTGCQMVLANMTALPNAELPKGVKAGWIRQGLIMLHRDRNEGMDVGAHNATLAYVARQPGGQARYGAYIFLNSSTRGPFFPAYMPPGWQWTHAFTSRLSDTVKVVGSSLVCLPPGDAGGVGPKIESWAYATDARGLEVLVTAGVYDVYLDAKFGNSGVVVRGEYGISTFILAAGFNIATLMSRYAVGIDWRDRSHWECNDQVHPSRLGTYDSISQHPFETVFVKASWGTGEPFTSKYSEWRLQLADGSAGTGGRPNPKLFLDAAKNPAKRPMLQKAMACYKPL